MALGRTGSQWCMFIQCLGQYSKFRCSLGWGCCLGRSCCPGRGCRPGRSCGLRMTGSSGVGDRGEAGASVRRFLMCTRCPALDALLGTECIIVTCNPQPGWFFLSPLYR